MNQTHDDQSSLIDALDEWYAILRDRLQAPVPRKPACPREIAVLGRACGVKVPPDVLALYEYSNGAWLDDHTPMNRAFLPDGFFFHPLPPVGMETSSMTWQWADVDMRDGAFDDLPGREWEQTIPVFMWEATGHLSVVASAKAFQAVAFFTVDGMRWAARRLEDIISAAVRMEKDGLLVWGDSYYLEFDESRFRGALPPPPEYADGYQGWVWESLDGSRT